MQRRMRLIFAAVTLSALTSVALPQWRRYATPTPDLPLAGEPKEWTFARLAYDGAGFRGRGSFDTDYPRAEYHFSQAVERLTRIDVYADGHVVSPNTDDLFDYPWLYAVEVGYWGFSDSQATRMREYLLRGGFLMVDDFHGTREWAIFVESMRRVFPDRPVVDLPDDDPIFHTFWDLEERQQIPGLQYVYSGRPYEHDGFEAHWRAIYDDKGRVMVAICHNMDLGDAVEHSDTPAYPEELSAVAMRTFLNYIIYSMTH